MNISEVLFTFLSYLFLRISVYLVTRLIFCTRRLEVAEPSRQNPPTSDFSRYLENLASIPLPYKATVYTQIVVTFSSGFYPP